MEPLYLGDGVYVSVDSGMLELKASNGVARDDKIIYLEKEVFLALQQYAEKVWPDLKDNVS